MKIEVLKDIKKTEEEYKKMISEAEAARVKSLADAQLEGDNLIQKANADAEEYKKKCIADAKSTAASRYDAILKKGRAEATVLEQKGRQNLDKAVEMLVDRFKEQLHVQS